MKLGKIRFKNTFTFGNAIKEVDLNSLKGIIQIVGKNGVGKSSIAKIIKIGVYQESEGIPVKEIANDINGESMIDVEYFEGQDRYNIISEYGRGGMDSLEIRKNGIKEDTGKIPDTKLWIKKNLNLVPYHIFANLINLSVGKSKSFLDMDADDCRKIRDRLFSFHVINEVHTKVSKELLELNKSILEKNSKLESLTNSLQELENTYNENLKEGKEKKETKKNELEEKLALVLQEKEDLLERQKDLNTEITSINSDLDALSTQDNNVKLLEKEKYLKELEEYKEKLDNSNATHKITINNYKSLLKYYSDLKIYEECKKQRGVLTRDIGDHAEGLEELAKEEKLYEGYRAKLQSNENLNGLIKKEQESLDNLILYNTKDGLLKSLKTNIADNEEQLKTLNENLESGIETRRTRRDELALVEKKIKLHEEGKCGECGSDLTSQDALVKLSSLKEDASLLETKIGKIQVLIEKIESSLVPIKEAIKSNKATEKEYETDLAVLKSKIIKGHIELGEKAVGESITEAKNGLVSEGDLKVIKDSMLSETTYELLQDNVKDLHEAILINKAFLDKNEPLVKDFKIDNTISDTEEEAAKKMEEISTKFDSNSKKLLTAVSEIATTTSERDSLKLLVKEELITVLVKKGKEELEKRKSEIDKENEEIKTDLESKKHGETAIRTELDVLEKNNSEESSEKFKKQIEDFKVQKEDFEKKRDEVSASAINIGMYQKTLTDTGIKSYIIKNYIPQINLIIQQILSEQDINIRCKFNDEFKAVLSRNGREVSNTSISTGQSKMIDTAIIIAITKLLKMKYPSINFVFYDEVFSSLHSDNINITLALIKKYVVGELGLTTFLVNHSYIGSSYFDQIMSIENKNGFSDFTISTPQEYEALNMASIDNESVSMEN